MWRRTMFAFRRRPWRRPPRIASDPAIQALDPECGRPRKETADQPRVCKRNAHTRDCEPRSTPVEMRPSRLGESPATLAREYCPRCGEKSSPGPHRPLRPRHWPKGRCTERQARGRARAGQRNSAAAGEASPAARPQTLTRNRRRVTQWFFQRFRRTPGHPPRRATGRSWTQRSASCPSRTQTSAMCGQTPHSKRRRRETKCPPGRWRAPYR